MDAMYVRMDVMYGENGCMILTLSMTKFTSWAAWHYIDKYKGKNVKFMDGTLIVLGIRVYFGPLYST